MLKKIAVFILILACAALPSPAFAYGGHGGWHGGWHGGGYHWGHGGWYWGWGAIRLAETAAVLHAAYAYPPYVVAAPVGYVEVAQPPVAYVPAAAPVAYTPAAAPAAAPAVASAAPAPAIDESLDIHIPNGNGSFTLVRLQKTANGYLGPQGEFYADHPTEDQLRARYLK